MVFQFGLQLFVQLSNNFVFSIPQKGGKGESLLPHLYYLEKNSSGAKTYANIVNQGL